MTSNNKFINYDLIWEHIQFSLTTPLQQCSTAQHPIPLYTLNCHSSSQCIWLSLERRILPSIINIPNTLFPVLAITFTNERVSDWNGRLDDHHAALCICSHRHANYSTSQRMSFHIYGKTICYLRFSVEFSSYYLCVCVSECVCV